MIIPPPPRPLLSTKQRPKLYLNKADSRPAPGSKIGPHTHLHWTLCSLYIQTVMWIQIRICTNPHYEDLLDPGGKKPQKVCQTNAEYLKRRIEKHLFTLQAMFPPPPWIRIHFWIRIRIKADADPGSLPHHCIFNTNIRTVSSSWADQIRDIMTELGWRQFLTLR